MSRTPLVPAAVAATSTLAFAALARHAHRHPRNGADTAVRDAALAHSPEPVKEAHRPLRPLGKWYTLVPLSLAGGALLAWRRGLAAGAPLALVGVLGMAAAEGSEAWLPSRSPPPGRDDPEEPAFPSGHALQTTAVALTGGYLLWREGLLPAGLAAPLAVGVPLLIGTIQVPGERHWMLDVVGGWVAGLGLSAACAALYEGLRARS